MSCFFLSHDKSKPAALLSSVFEGIMWVFGAAVNGWKPSEFPTKTMPRAMKSISTGMNEG